jgi:pimeloyl-ACP methyl ester carboxylesterase
MSEFVLVHGAWHGAWCWYKVVPELEALGHAVHVVELPSHGIDKTPIAEVTLDAYVERVGSVLAECGEPAVLVGHSMGGIVISQAAERYADLIRGLIYLTALLLKDGESLGDNPVQASPDDFRTAFEPTADGLAVGFREDRLEEAFYADCSPADVTLARVCLVPQAAAILGTRLRISEQNWGRLPRSYITCAADRALTLEGQRQMIERVGMDRVVDMATSHSPFFSAPVELARHLNALAA